jgi:hypothetical protein
VKEVEEKKEEVKVEEKKEEVKVEEKKAEEKKVEEVKVEVRAPMVYTTAAQQPILPYAAYAPYTTQVIQQQIVPRYHAKNGEVEHIVAKREAEAEADAQYLYAGVNPMYAPYAARSMYAANPMVYGYANPMVYSGVAQAPINYNGVTAKTYANDFSPFTQGYAGKGMYVADSVGARHVAKREAEAEPQFPYNAMYNTPLAYNAMYNTPLAYNTYANPMIYSAAVAQPVVYKTETKLVDPLTGVTAKTYANDFSPFTQGYAAKGQYVADSVGARHIAKREAEAQWPYNTLYNTPLAYNAYNTYNAYNAYRPYNYGYNNYASSLYSGVRYF